ncbi:MAG TPA: hypothetical protein VIK28_08200 [Sedimentisphaerales bacterium]
MDAAPAALRLRLKHRNELSPLRLAWWITRAEYSVISEIDIQLFLHRRFDIDLGQDAKPTPVACQDACISQQNCAMSC